jgi:hypothetical protein
MIRNVPQWVEIKTINVNLINAYRWVEKHKQIIQKNN